MLAHNQLSKVPANVFSHLTLLNSLELEGNQINYVDKDAFAGLEGRPYLSMLSNSDSAIRGNKFYAGCEYVSLSLQRIYNIYAWAITISIRFQVNR